MPENKKEVPELSLSQKVIFALIVLAILAAIGHVVGMIFFTPVPQIARPIPQYHQLDMHGVTIMVPTPGGVTNPDDILVGTDPEYARMTFNVEGKTWSYHISEMETASLPPHEDVFVAWKKRREDYIAQREADVDRLQNSDFGDGSIVLGVKTTERDEGGKFVTWTDVHGMGQPTIAAASSVFELKGRVVSLGTMRFGSDDEEEAMANLQNWRTALLQANSGTP